MNQNNPQISTVYWLVKLCKSRIAHQQLATSNGSTGLDKPDLFTILAHSRVFSRVKPPFTSEIRSLEFWPFMSYRWLFLWGYTLYKWG